MKALCQKVEYRAGSFELIQGVNGHSEGKSKGGKFFVNRGHGWGEHIESSKLILHATIRGKQSEIWIDHFFKDNLGRLIERRRILIGRTMPEAVDVKRAEGQKGTKYYVVSEDDLNAWLARCNDSVNATQAETAAKKFRTSRKKKEAEQEAVAEAHRQRFERTLERELGKQPKAPTELAFRRGRNPKHGSKQWEASYKGLLYVLDRSQSYDASEGAIPVKKAFDLVPGRVVLVNRI